MGHGAGFSTLPAAPVLPEFEDLVGKSGGG